MKQGQDQPHIRSYKLRTSRLGPEGAEAIGRMWPTHGIDVDGKPLDLVSIFGERPVVLEIGFGMGEATADLASMEPDVGILAVDVHTPGVASLLRQVDRRGLDNIRVAEGDAVILLRDMLPPSSLAGVRIFFPDPWPKLRHRKRRLVTESFCSLIASRLAPGGVLHLATDWLSYAEQVAALLAGQPDFELLEREPWRPTTRFEQQGIAAGRNPTDIAARRVAGVVSRHE